MKKLGTIFIAVMMLLVVATTAMAAAEPGGFAITEETGYTYEDGVLTIEAEGTYNIGMAKDYEITSDTIVVAPDVYGDVQLIFDDVKIQCTGDEDTIYGIKGDLCQLIIGGTLDLDVQGTDVDAYGIYTTSRYAREIGQYCWGSITVLEDAEVNITVQGNKKVYGMYAQDDITIKGAVTSKVEATGSDSSARARAIRSQNDNQDATITISGNAQVTAEAKQDGNAMAAYGIYAYNFRMTGGTVQTTAIANQAGAYGISANSDKLEITGGTLTATVDGNRASTGISGKSVRIADDAIINVVAKSRNDNVTGITASSETPGMGILKIEGGEINVNVEALLTSGSAGANADGINACRKMEITGGIIKVAASANKDVAYGLAVGTAGESIEIHNATVMSTGKSVSDKAYGIGKAAANLHSINVTIADSTVIAKGLSTDGEAYGIQTDESLTVTGDRTFLKATGATKAVWIKEADGTAETGSLPVKASLNGILGTYVNDAAFDATDCNYKSNGEIVKYLMIAPTVYEYTVGDDKTAADYAEHLDCLEIKAPGTYKIGLADGVTTATKPIKVTATGEVTLILDGVKIQAEGIGETNAIYANGNTLTIQGTLDATATAVTGNAYVIQADTLILTDVTLTASANAMEDGSNAYGIYAAQDIAIEDYTYNTWIYAKGSTKALKAGNALTLAKTLAAHGYGTDAYDVAVEMDSTNQYYMETESGATVTNIQIGTTGPISSGVRKYSNNLEVGKGGSATVEPLRAAAKTQVQIVPTAEAGYKVGSVTVAYESGREVAVTDNGDGTYYYTQPGATVTVTVTFVGAESFFVDVPESAWFYEAVKYVYDAGIMNGTSTTKFSPNESTTRGMIAAMIYRLEGSPDFDGEMTFTDVATGSYYETAIAWAQDKGIVTGYSDEVFKPDQNISREQLAAILHRYANYLKQDVTVGENTNILSYNDAFDITEYAIPSIQWMCGAGLMEGTETGNLMPKGLATRAQVATVLMRYLAD